MKIVVSAQGETLEAATSPVFGRCPTYLFVDTATMQCKALPNPAMGQGGGAGVQAAQFVVEHGAQAVLTGNLGPNAFEVLQAAGIPAYQVADGSVQQAVVAFQGGQLSLLAGANVAAHAGMGGGAARGASSVARPAASQPHQPQNTAQAELDQLQESLKSLRQELARTMDRIDELERQTKQTEEG